MTEAWEGLYFVNSTIAGQGFAEKFTTIAEIEVFDLISEGEIEGPVSGYYIYSGTVGLTGYTGYIFTPYRGIAQAVTVSGNAPLVSPWARSIYYNNTPVINSSGQLNFANVDVNWTNGSPISNVDLAPTNTQYLSRIIGEPLRQTQITTNKPLPASQSTTDGSSEYIAPYHYQDSWNTSNQINPNFSAYTRINNAATSLPAYDPWPTQLTTRAANQGPYQATFYDNVKVYQILNTECVGVVVNFKVASLQVTLTADIGGQDKGSAGDIRNNTVYIGISYRPIFLNEYDNRSVWKRPAKTFAITGKILAGAIFPVNLSFDDTSDLVADRSFMGFEICVFRISRDSLTSTNQSNIYIDSISEIFNESFTYPNCALVRSRFDSEYFQQIPDRSFRMRLLKVKIPSNYDPIARTYNDPWDGTFADKKQWTNNPAWCYYDLITNPRYGLGKYIDEDLIDVWSLYQIAQYCDVLVDDGYGSIEPRFTFNWWFTTREDAFKVINDMTSAFRAMIYYGFGSIYTIQDSPKTPNYIFTNANVVDGNFSYSTSAMKDRHTVAIIRYNDPRNMYQAALEYVEDVDGIRKYGIREVDFTAFGCASRGQALRLGRWMLLSETMETEMIAFGVGQDGALLRPGDVIGVFDEHRKINRYAGRTLNYNLLPSNAGTQFVLDAPVYLQSGLLYTFSVLTPTYFYEAAQVTDLNSSDIPNIRRPQIQSFPFVGSGLQISGNYSVLTLTGVLDTTNYSGLNSMVWTVDYLTGSPGHGAEINSGYFIQDNYDYYRIIRISEKGDGTYDVAGLQYAIDKYQQIESGIGFQVESPQTSVNPSSPTALTLSTVSDGTIAHIKYNVTLPDLNGVSALYVYARPDVPFDVSALPDYSYLVNKVNSPTLNTVDFHLPKLNNKTYYFAAFTINNSGNIVSSVSATGAINYTSGFDITKVTVSNLSLASATYGLSGYSGLTINMNNQNPTFTWNLGTTYDANLYPYSQAAFEQNMPCRVTIRQPTYGNTGTISPIVFYERTGLYRTNGLYSFTFDFGSNVSASGGPYRNYDVVVEAHDASGNTSAGNKIFTYTGERYSSYPGGYVAATFVNPVPTGIELSNNVLTSPYSGASGSGIVLTYQTNQYIGPNGDLTIIFTSGTLPTNIVGGFIYISSGQFPKREAIFANTGAIVPATGNLYVYRYEFTNFNTSFPLIYHPYAGFNLTGIATGYISIGFYDDTDSLRKNSNANAARDVITGMNISNNAIITSNAAVANLSVSNGLQLRQGFNTTGPTIRTVMYSGNSGLAYQLISIDSSGNQTILGSNIKI